MARGEREGVPARHGVVLDLALANSRGRRRLLPPHPAGLPADLFNNAVGLAGPMVCCGSSELQQARLQLVTAPSSPHTSHQHAAPLRSLPPPPLTLFRWPQSPPQPPTPQSPPLLKPLGTVPLLPLFTTRSCAVQSSCGAWLDRSLLPFFCPGELHPQPPSLAYVLPSCLLVAGPMVTSMPGMAAQLAALPKGACFTPEMAAGGLMGGAALPVSPHVVTMSSSR